MRKPAICALFCLAGIFAVAFAIKVESKNERKKTETVLSHVSGSVASPQISVPVRPGEISDLKTSASVVHEYAQLPMAFEPNVGQSNSEAEFLARGEGYALFLAPREAVLVLRKPLNSKKITDSATETIRSLRAGSQATGVVRMHLVGTNSAAAFTALDELPGKSNYLIGKEPANWYVNISNYRKVAERGVYPGIDLVYYGTQRQLEYDFVVEPGADPRAIQLAIEGQKKLRINARGELVASVEGGEVRVKRPVAYQDMDGDKQAVTAKYVLRNDGGVGFQLGEYDPSRSLVIDPILSYSTYLGGSNIDGAYAIAVASDKTAFITGGTYSLDFPVAHPLQPNHGGPDDFFRDAFVSKLSADGSMLLYSTYLGGKFEDVGYGIAVDAFGDAYVTGTTESPDFPVPSTIPSFNPLCGGDGACGATWNPQGFRVRNGFVTKLNPEGSVPLYSGFLGYYENVISQAISVDANQIAYVTGQVGPNITPTVPIIPPKVPPPPFPITPNAAQPTFGGGVTDAFVMKISATGNSIQYSTYLGGSDEEIGYGIATDGNANAYVTGITYSSNFPVLNPLQPSYGGAGDAFFSKINTDGSGTAPGPLLYSTYLGGNNLDQGNGIAVDGTGIAYITGTVGQGVVPFSTSTTSRCGNGVAAGPCGGTADAFVAKMDATKSGALSLMYFTYLGGSLADAGNGIAVDTSGNAYVTGSTVSTDFPITAAVFQPKYGGGNADAFVAEIDPSGSTLAYSSYLGGTNTDIGYGIAVDSTSNSTGAAYVAGQTCSQDFPLANPFQAAPGGNCDAFVSKIEILSGLQLNPAGLVFSGQSLSTTSQPQVVTITNGDNAQTIGSITITGPNPGDTPGDFAEMTTCGTSLTPGAQCTISVTFTPMAAGIRKAQINVPCPTCGTSGITYVLNLTGTSSTLTLSPANLAFPNQQVGVPGTAQSIIATNNGTVPITFSSITASGDFAETDNCTKVALQPTTNCVISVTYSPTTAGNSIGALTLTDNAPGSPQVVLLTGTGFGQQSDFTFSATPTSAAVPAGKSAQFNLTISSIGGFAQPISLSCSGLPAAASCAATANPVTLSGTTTTTVTVIVNTGLRTFVPSGRPISVQPPRAMSIFNLGRLAVLTLLLATTALFSFRARRVAAMLVPVGLVVIIIFMSMACNGGGQAGAPAGTPAGTYQIGITGTSGVISHTATVTLQVK